MDAHLDRIIATCLWAGLSLAAAALSAQLGLAWMERARATGLRNSAQRLIAAGVSLGTGIWLVHVFSAPVEGAGLAWGAAPGLQFAVWACAVGAAMAALAWLDPRQAKASQWVPAAAGLGTALVALQMLGVADRAAPWQFGALALAWALAQVGTVLAFGLAQGLQGRSGAAAAWRRAGAGLVWAAAVVLSQHLVAEAGGLSSQRAPATHQQLTGLALVVLAGVLGGGLLAASLVMLRRHLKAQAAVAKESRTQRTKLLLDPLTGLPNRQLFEGTLAQAVQQADAAGRALALLFINVDGFRAINEAFGHNGGDRVLCKVASRLRALSGPHMAARLASDEFLILMPGNPGREEASELAFSLLAAVARPFNVDGRTASLSCSVGVAMYPEDGALSALIRHAEAAMRAAKSAGGASHALFEPRMLSGARDDAALLRDLRQALGRGELELYYQPKIHAPSGEITGAEALMRWNHPRRGMVSPGVFIPLAERYGLINELGRWVIDEACRQTRVWRDAGLRMRVAINLSVHQLRQPDLAERFEEVLRRHQIKPELITCEITESSAMEDTEVTMRVLRQLNLIGLHISIDDFGTGHSSLAYLRKLPAQELKIDRSFVLDLETSEDARKVASAVINLAKALDLKVVAEGVETEGQNRILREYGCDQLQGYLFAKPMSAKALALWAMHDVGPRTMNFRSSLFKESTQLVVA
jgi:diguanylate cyclase (GGDEF)-like protein